MHNPAGGKRNPGLTRRRFGTALGTGLLACAACNRQPSRKVMKTGKRVVLLGMDGLDPVLLKKYMDQGALPAFQALAREGGFLPLATSNPPQSPVAWTNIATGVNPGRHGIFDFLRRDPKSFGITLTINKHKGGAHYLKPFEAETFWEKAAKAGIESTVLRWPLTFPSKGNTTVLGGLGVPDIRGYLGDYSLYTTAELPKDDDNNKYTVPLEPFDKGFKSQIRGPAKSATAFHTIPLLIKPESGQVTIECAGKTITLKENGWSELISFSFSMGMFKRVKGIGQFCLARAANPMILYLSPIGVDPADPVFPIGNPPGFTRSLAGEIGTFHTLGMPEDINAIKRGALAPAEFLASCNQIMDQQETMLHRTLAGQTDGLVSFVFFSSDRIQHMFWAGVDEAHPFNGLSDPPGSFFSHFRDFHALGEEPIRTLYKRMDSIVAKVRSTLSEKDVLMVLSDHGFTTFRRRFHVNRFLADEGLLALTDGKKPSAIFPNVNWRNTKAYSMGFAGIYLNLAGREHHGMVSQSQGVALLDGIKKKLLALKDPETGLSPVKQVWRGEAIYQGPMAGQAPDLVLGLERGYRFSEETALGDAGDALFQANPLPWTGTHLVAPGLVPGVLLANAPLKTQAARGLDIAPTVLSALGLPVSEGLEGQNIL